MAAQPVLDEGGCTGIVRKMTWKTTRSRPIHSCCSVPVHAFLPLCGMEEDIPPPDLTVSIHPLRCSSWTTFSRNPFWTSSAPCPPPQPCLDVPLPLCSLTTRAIFRSKLSSSFVLAFFLLIFIPHSAVHFLIQGTEAVFYLSILIWWIADTQNTFVEWRQGYNT